MTFCQECASLIEHAGPVQKYCEPCIKNKQRQAQAKTILKLIIKIKNSHSQKLKGGLKKDGRTTNTK